MSKRRKSRRSQLPATATPAETATTGVQVTERGPGNPRIDSPHHNGNHNQLLVQVASAKSRKPGSPTAFGKVELFGSAHKGENLHLYIASASMVAVSFGPEQDYRCWRYASYSVSDEQTAVSLLGGKHPGHVEACTKRNTIHARLPYRVDMGLVADLGAAAAFVGMRADIGEPNLPAMTYAGSARAQNGEERPIRARLFAPARGSDSPIAVATTHLREDTTSMLAFEGSNMDAIAASLNRGDMNPGGECHSLPEFVDLSMFRAEQSAEAYIGQLMARSLCQFAAV